MHTYISSVGAFRLCILFAILNSLWGQTAIQNDSLDLPFYNLLLIKNPESQAELNGYETDTPHKYFSLSMNGHIYQSFFPPVQTSADSIQLLTFKYPHTQYRLNGYNNDIDFIEFNYQGSYHLGTASRYLLFSYLPAMIASLLDKREDSLAKVLIGLTYLLPTFTLGGAFAANAPDHYHLDINEYMKRRSAWNWELGYSIGRFTHRIEEFYGYRESKDTYAQGIYFSIKRNYSPFSYSFRLYHIPHPNYDIYRFYDPSFEEYSEVTPSKGNDILVNPFLKTTVVNNNGFKLNVLTGFMAEIRNIEEEPEFYYYDEINFWGVIEPELQYYLGSHLALSLSISSQYNYERSRFPIFFSLQYCSSYLNEPGLDLNRISLSPLYQNITLNKESYNYLFSAYGLAVSLGLGPLTELTYMLMIRQRQNQRYYIEDENTIVQTIKYSAFTRGLIAFGLSFGATFGDVYDSGIEFLSGPSLKISLSQHVALLANYEIGLIGLLDISDYTTYWYTLGFTYQF